MKWHRIKAILLEEMFVTRHSLEVIVDIFYFSVINIVIFGFIALFLVGQSNVTAAQYILIGMIQWEVIRVAQYTITVGSLWEIWSKNLSNLFVAPLSLKEYIGAQMLSGAVKALLSSVLVSVIAAYVFHFNILQLGVPNLIVFFINLTLFAWSLGIVLLGLIFRYGTRIQALAWSMVYLFQPLSACLFPLTVLPQPLQHVALFIPATYVFEAARHALSHPEVDWQYASMALGLNIIYLTLSTIFFNYMFNKSKETGQFARNES